MARPYQTKKGGRTMNLIDQIRNFNVEGTALEDLVALSAQTRIVQAEFESLKIEAPEFLDLKGKEIRREILSRQADRLEKLLREKKSRREALMPAEEKRQALDKEIAELEQRLAGGQ